MLKKNVTSAFDQPSSRRHLIKTTGDLVSGCRMKRKMGFYASCLTETNELEAVHPTIHYIEADCSCVSQTGRLKFYLFIFFQLSKSEFVMLTIAYVAQRQESECARWIYCLRLVEIIV